MTTTPYEPKDSLALTALTELYSDSAEQFTEAELDRGLKSYLARVASVNTRPWSLVRWPVAAAALALCTLVALLVNSVIRMRMPAPALPMLTYQIDGGRVVEGGYLRESGHAGMSVTFNEGSRFALTPGTRGQIREVDRGGARVAIERGTASLQVTPGSGRRWLVDAGPFLVTVKGTVLTVSWDPLSEQFELSLQRGRVVVSGPVSAGEIALRAGQRLAVNLARAETVITEENQEQTLGEAVGASVQLPATAPDPTPSAVSNETTGPNPPHASVSSAVAKIGAERRWSDELAHGQWDRILEDVRRAGIDVTLSEASSEDLFAVADAARYRRQPDLARAALLAVRRRFPGSPRALDAIFLLGRVEESRASGAAPAIARYDEYLARTPNGPFAGEALGRKMTLTDAVEGPARAQPIAEEYLRRFPKGSYAGSARALIHVQ
jgi:transmembrane sensor